MRALKILVAAAAALVFLTVTDPASASRGHRGGGHRGPHVSVGVWGPGWWGGWGGWGWRGAWGPGWWGPGWSAGWWGPAWGPAWGPGWSTWPSTVVVVPQEPRVFVERDEVAAPTPPAAQSAPQWWYWCASAQQYFPYVSTCSEGWQRVTPQPVRPQ